jgi:ATP-binding cassette subfamily F protein 3
MNNARIGYLPQYVDEGGSETPWQICTAVYGDLQEMQARLHKLEAQLADPEQSHEALERYGHLQQAFEHAGGYEYEVEVRTVLNGLGLDDVHIHRAIDQLSGGQRTRAQLARLLLEKPHILILDEPTNHLDLEAIEWLESYLQAWPEALLVVSHDRRFLDKVANKIWDMSLGQLTVYRGNYTHYAEQRASRHARARREWKAQQADIAKTEDYIRRNMAGQRTKQAQGRATRLNRLERLERPQEEHTIHLSLGGDHRSGDLVLRTRDLVVGYDHPLLTVPDLELRRLHRAALIGPNGSGKTTLLKTILGQMPPLAGEARLGASLRIGYWAQEREDLDPEHTIVDEIMRVHDLTVPEVRDLMARFLFTGDDPFKRIGDLSGGEQCRVALAKLTLAEPNLLVLDEPTNQLDIPTQEIVEQVLREFIGTTLFVSHDRYLIDALATQVWAIQGSTLRVYEGNYQEFLSRRQAEEAARREEADREREAERQRRHRDRMQQRTAKNDGKTIEELEAEIAELEQELQTLEQAMAQASTEGHLDRVYDFDVEYRRVHADLEQLIAEWVALGEASEQ